MTAETQTSDGFDRAAIRKAAAKFEAISKLRRLIEWLEEDPDNILLLDPEHVDFLRMLAMKRQTRAQNDRT